MKTATQFAKWLDEKTDYLDSIVEDDYIRLAEEFGGIVVEAGQYAAQFGCDSFAWTDETTPHDAKVILGKYRAWIAPQLPREDLTVDEAAEKLGVSVQTIRAMVNDGRLAHYRVGRQIRIRPEDCVMRIEEKPEKKYRHLGL